MSEVATPSAEERDIGFRWEDPPEKRQGRVSLPWPVWARLLRRRPGRWARLHDFPGKSSAYTVARRFRRGDYAPRFSDEEFELRPVATDTGSALFGRFIGWDE